MATPKKRKKQPRRLIKAPITLLKIEDINFQAIKAGFSVKGKSQYVLPRIAFIGYYDCLSMGDQRHIAKNLGFEYYEGIKFAILSDVQMQVLTTKWPDIFANHTRLIVLGDHSFEKTTPGNDSGPPQLLKEFEYFLFRAYQREKSVLPIFAESNIPIIMESELIKLHPDYPNINNSTVWADKQMELRDHQGQRRRPDQPERQERQTQQPTEKSAGAAPQQRSLFDLG